MEYENISWGFLGRVISETFYQFFALFGFILLFGIILYFISRFTRNVFRNSDHLKLDIYLTGWIGTPVHELGHAFFCLIFGHRITEIILFSPNSEDGTLGYIHHSYNSKSLYQRIGFFFIGAGPILFGSIVLYGLLYAFLPNYQEITGMLPSVNFTDSGISDWMKNTGNLFSVGMNLMIHVFKAENFALLSFWVFLYLSFCISSHMQLSPPDLKSMFSGLITILLVLLVINLLVMFLGFDFTVYVLKISRFIGRFLGIFILAIFLSLINFITTYVFLAVFHYLKYRKILSIF
jgi:hypothetical protein